jgi:hypothetical protein
MQDLGTLPGYTSSEAYGINDGAVPDRPASQAPQRTESGDPSRATPPSLLELRCR